MELRINQQYAQLGLDIKKPRIQLQTTAPEIELQTTLAQIKIKAPAARISIDQSECFADAGKRQNLDFALYNSEQGRTDLASGIQRIVAEGEYAAGIEKGNKIEDQCGESGNKEAEFNIDVIPKHRPTINVDVQPVDIQIADGSVNVNLKRGNVVNNLQWGQVEAYLIQKNNINISWIGNQLNHLA